MCRIYQEQFPVTDIVIGLYGVDIYTFKSELERAVKQQTI